MAAMIAPLFANSHGLKIRNAWDAENDVTLFTGDCREFLGQLPNDSAQLIVTSPPYNIGKSYEHRTSLDAYLAREKEVINRCIDKLKPGGSICWQVGNFVDDGAIIPIDSLLYPIFAGLGLKMRNRIVWHFEHEFLWRN